MTTRATLLVASTPDGQYIAQHALSNDYDLRFVSTLREAKQTLNDGDEITMVLAGIHFDDSRMVELLQYIRTTDHLEKLPFIAFQAIQGSIDTQRTVGEMVKKLGCCDFLALHAVPIPRAQKLLKNAVINCFDKPIRKLRIDKH